MRCLYTSRNNSFNHPIFQSKLLELLSRNYKNKKKITMESLSFRQKLSTSKISHTNSYINSNTNTNTNSIIKQSGNNTKRNNSKTKININSKHKFSMSNDNFNEYNKKKRNFDVINTIYTTNNNSKNKNNHYLNTNNNKKRSKSKNNNCIKNEKSSKSKKKKKMNTSKKIMINLENDLSLKKENQRLKMQLLELQNEYEKLKNENDLLVSQNRNQNTCLSKQEKIDISNEKKTKKINKLNNKLNLEINNFENNYPCDYFNINNSNNYNNCKNKSPIHDYISSKNIFNTYQDKKILSHKASKDNIRIERNGNYFTIGNNDKINTDNKNQTKLLNTSKNKILLSMYNIKNIKNKLNKSSSRYMTQNDKSYVNCTIFNTEKFFKNLKKNKIKEKLRPQELIYVPNNKNIKNEECIIKKGIFNDKIKNIALRKGKSNNLFELNMKNISLSARGNNQNKNALNLKGNIKNIIIKKVESKKSTSKFLNYNNSEKEFKCLQEKMENIYQRAKNLLTNYDTFIEYNIKLNK